MGGDRYLTRGFGYLVLGVTSLALVGAALVAATVPSNHVDLMFLFMPLFAVSVIGMVVVWAGVAFSELIRDLIRRHRPS